MTDDAFILKTTSDGVTTVSLLHSTDGELTEQMMAAEQQVRRLRMGRSNSSVFAPSEDRTIEATIGICFACFFGAIITAVVIAVATKSQSWEGA